jgi:NADPH-dependent glutamate synthase beta subunit-like oxidoreductase
VTQMELLPRPPDERAISTPWPLWPTQLRSGRSHEEGGIRDWSVRTLKFTADEHGNVNRVHAVRVGPPPKYEPFANGQFPMDVDLVLLALGFMGPVKRGRAAWGETRRVRECCRRREPYVVGAWHSRGRRHAARAIIGGMGYCRGAQGCARNRSTPDGHDAAAVESVTGGALFEGVLGCVPFRI